MGNSFARDHVEKAKENAVRDCDASDKEEKMKEQTARNYIELDHALVPGKIEDINLSKKLETGKVEEKVDHYFHVHKMQLRKYPITKGNIVKAIINIKNNRPETLSVVKFSTTYLGFEAVQGTLDDNFYFDKDWGFFSTILACYNNHWTLRTSPDD